MPKSRLSPAKDADWRLKSFDTPVRAPNGASGAATHSLQAQVTIGPAIEDGFYYDFAYERAFTPEDLAAENRKAHERDLAGAKQKLKSPGRLMSRNDAVASFQEKLGKTTRLKSSRAFPLTKICHSTSRVTLWIYAGVPTCRQHRESCKRLS